MSFWNLTVARAVIACQLSLCLFWVVISVNFSKGMPIPICWTYHFRISNFPCYFSVWNKLMREQINNFLPWRKVELEKWGRVAGKVYSIQPTKIKQLEKLEPYWFIWIIPMLLRTNKATEPIFQWIATFSCYHCCNDCSSKSSVSVEKKRIRVEFIGRRNRKRSNFQIVNLIYSIPIAENHTILPR